MRVKVTKRNPKGTLFLISEGEKPLGVLPKKMFCGLSLGEGENDIDLKGYQSIVESIIKHAFTRLLSYLGRAEHSNLQCTYFLRKIPLCAELIPQVLEKAVSRDFVNDSRFARMIVQKDILRNKSKGYIINSLVSKGISKSDYEPALQKCYTAKRFEIAKTNLQKAKRKFANVKNKFQKDRKILEFMKRRGFSYGDILEVDS